MLVLTQKNDSSILKHANLVDIAFNTTISFGVTINVDTNQIQTANDRLLFAGVAFNVNLVTSGDEVPIGLSWKDFQRGFPCCHGAIPNLEFARHLLPKF